MADCVFRTVSVSIFATLSLTGARRMCALLCYQFSRSFPSRSCEHVYWRLGIHLEFLSSSRVVFGARSSRRDLQIFPRILAFCIWCARCHNWNESVIWIVSKMRKMEARRVSCLSQSDCARRVESGSKWRRNAIFQHFFLLLRLLLLPPFRSFQVISSHRTMPFVCFSLFFSFCFGPTMSYSNPANAPLTFIALSRCAHKLPRQIIQKEAATECNQKKEKKS